jgi:hypothetical protein
MGPQCWYHNQSNWNFIMYRLACSPKNIANHKELLVDYCLLPNWLAQFDTFLGCY